MFLRKGEALCFRAMNLSSPSLLKNRLRQLAASALLLLLVTGVSQQAHALAISARVAAVKGHATISTPGGEVPLTQGASVRAGSVISCSANSGVLLRPAPRVSVVIFMSSKVRFDGSEMSPGTAGDVRYSVLVGRAMFTIDPSTEGGGVHVAVSTEVGTIEGTRGSWTVNCEQDRTSVAVGEGSTDVTLGGGATAANGVGGQVQVPEGSVIWLTRGAEGRVEAKLVNTITGTVVVIGANGQITPPQKAPPDLLDQSTKILDTSGDSTNPSGGGLSGGGSNTPSEPKNPDLSTPKPDRPVVSPANP